MQSTDAITGQRRNIAIALPSMGDEEADAVRTVIESGWLTQGPTVARFERAFAEQHHVRHALATTSCTTALHLALEAAGVGPGDEVIVPAFTWVATANAVLYCGATPVLCDIDLTTFNIDVDAAATLVTERTAAVLPVHLFGLCAAVDTLRQSLPSGVMIIEDAACAAGATLNGHSAGSLGDAGCFSFHPRKSISCGEGGMVTTNDVDLAARAEVLRNHGASISEEQRHRGAQPYLLPDFDTLGYNYRMTDLQAAIAAVQLEKLESFIAQRSERAAYYRAELAGLEWLRMPSAPMGWRHAWQSFVTTIDSTTAPIERNELMRRLHERGVATRPGTHAVHTLGYYRDRFGYRPEDFPQARTAELRSMAIPLHNRMTEADYDYVIAMIHECSR
jgi:dTDP-4-amino-4,6-dideoxygalactose transaminase